MENKNNGSLVVWLLVIIIILLSIAVGTLIFKVYNTSGTQIIEGTNNVSQEQVNQTSKSEVVDEVENSENGESSINTNELTEARVLELAKRVLENSRGSSDSVVRAMCGFEIAKNGKQYTDAATGSLYNLSDVSYTKFKIEVLKNFSEKYFEELNNFKGRKIVIEKDGYVGVLEGTWSGIVHEIKSIKLTKTENDVWYYTVNASYKQGETSVDIMYDFGIKLVDNNYVIDSMITKYVN